MTYSKKTPKQHFFIVHGHKDTNFFEIQKIIVYLCRKF